MRFFSNENRESNDEPTNVDVQTRATEVNEEQSHDEHPERVQSDPVSVPEQRSGSPWSDTPTSPAAPTSPDAEADAQDRGPDSVDLPLDDVGTASDEPRAESDELDGATTTTYGPDGTVITTESDDSAVTDADDAAVTDRDAAVTNEDAAVTNEDDDTTVVDPATDQPLDADTARTDSPDADTDDSDSDRSTDVEGSNTDDPATPPPSEFSLVDSARETSDDDIAGQAVTTSQGPAADNGAVPVVPIPVPVGAVGSDSGAATSDADPTGADTTGADPTAAAPAAAAPAEDKLPGSVAEPDLGTIFAEADAQSFHDQWRDVQLRFVDSPKEATAEAAGLLDEVVDKLATNLRAQKESLSNETSDDTEQLRVELRGYRDILNRILDL